MCVWVGGWWGGVGGRPGLKLHCVCVCVGGGLQVKSELFVCVGEGGWGELLS